MTTHLATLPGHLLEEPKRALVFLLLGFILSFIAVRLATRRARAGEQRRPARRQHRDAGRAARAPLGVRHRRDDRVRHPGVRDAALHARCSSSSPSPSAPGAALTLDEFALILHLEDVYWTGEGRQSIDAVILGGTFMTLLLTGLLPTSILEVGDFITLSRWTAFALILSAAAFVIVCYLKGKPFMGTIGIFVLPVAVIGALRLAQAGLAVGALPLPHRPRASSSAPASARRTSRTGGSGSTPCGTSSAASRTCTCRTARGASAPAAPGTTEGLPAPRPEDRTALGAARPEAATPRSGGRGGDRRREAAGALAQRVLGVQAEGEPEQALAALEAEAGAGRERDAARLRHGQERGGV